MFLKDLINEISEVSEQDRVLYDNNLRREMPIKEVEADTEGKNKREITFYKPLIWR